MEEKKTIFDYLAQVLTIFGFAMLIMNIFCLMFGESAKDFSALFALGAQGLPAEIAFQFLGIAALTVGLRFVFFTDALIKRMSIWLRTVCMLTAVIGVIAIFVAAFHWFPVNQWIPWAMFLACFGISFLGSYSVTVLRERFENKRMEEALRRLKEKEDVK